MKMKTVEYYDCEVSRCKVNHKTERGAISCSRKANRYTKRKEYRKKRNKWIVKSRDEGMTFTKIAIAVNLSTARVGQIYDNYKWEELKRQRREKGVSI